MMGIKKYLDVSKLTRSESVYSVASFAAFRLDREIGEDIEFESKELTVRRYSLEKNGLRNLIIANIDKLQTPLVFLSDLLMEQHYIEIESRKKSSYLSALSEKQIEILILTSSDLLVSAFESDSKKVQNKPSTVPFQCIEEYKDCICNNSGKALCSAGLVICMLQCIIPLAKGASGGRSENGDEE